MCKTGTIILFITCASLLPLFGNTQSTKVDSLKKEIISNTTIPGKLRALLTFCDEWESFNADTLHKYAVQAKQLAVATKNTDAILLADYYLAAYLFQKNRLDTALTVVNSVLARAKKETPYYNSNYVKFCGLKGNILMRTRHYDEVLKQDLALLIPATQNNDTIALVRANTGIGNIKLRLKEYDEALSWHYKALSLMRTDELKTRCSFVYLNIAVVYYHKSTINDTRENEDSIENNIQRAIKYSRQGNSLTNLANSLGMYGNVLAEYKKLQPAEAALTEAIEIRKKIGDVYYEIADMIALSSFYENNNNNKKAIDINLQALDLANKNGRDFSSLVSIYASLGEIYSNAGDYKKYSETLTERMQLQDSLYKANTAEAIAEIEAKYNMQITENIILQQKYSLARQTNLIYGISGVFLLLLFIVLILLKNRSQQQKIRIRGIMLENERKMFLAMENAREEERKRIISDLHDDVGGGLSTIRMVSDLISDQKEHSLLLEEYALKISGITKEVTQRMNTIVWALNAENDTLQNLSEYIREYGYSFFENTPITFQSNLPEDTGDIQLSGLQRKNLFLCVKESLNNAYKHSGAKDVQVSIVFVKNTLTVTIKDNGTGIINKSAFGNGLRNMQKRMAEINGSVSFKTDSGSTIMLKVFSVPAA